MPLNEHLATVPIPIRHGDADVFLQLQPAVDRECASGRHSHYLDYSRPLDPPLLPEEAEFAERILQKAGKR